MLIVDFDDTLFNTQAFKEDRMLAMCGRDSEFQISERIYNESYRKAYKDEDGTHAYSDERHAQVLAEMTGKDESELFKAFRSVADRMQQYLFPGVHEFLAQARQDADLMRQKLVLLSLGDPGFQQLKVDKTGITRYFHEIHFVGTSKVGVIKELMTVANEIDPNEEFFFINDKIEETVVIKLELGADGKRFHALLRRPPHIERDDYVAQYKEADAKLQGDGRSSSELHHVSTIHDVRSNFQTYEEYRLRYTSGRQGDKARL